MRIQPVGSIAMLPILGELAWRVQDLGAAGTSPLVCFSDDGPARDQEPQVMKPGTASGVGARFAGFVEEELRAASAVGPIVE